MDANNRLNRVFPFFDPFSSEFSPRDGLIDISLVISLFILQIEKVKKV